MKSILNKILNQDFVKPKEKKVKSIRFKDQNFITTTNSPLNNPPKRNNDKKIMNKSIIMIIYMKKINWIIIMIDPVVMELILIN